MFVAFVSFAGNDERVILRLATTSDAVDLCEIYRPYVEGTAISFETDDADTAGDE